MDDFFERLKRWRKRLDLDQSQAAKILGVGRTYYSRLESGTKSAGKFLVEKFNLIENESVHFAHTQLSERDDRLKEEALVGGYLKSRSSGTEPHALKVRKIPLIGWAKAGEIESFEDVVEWDEVITTEISNPQSIAIRVRGDSMEPQFPDGVIAVVSREKAHDGQLVVARLKDDGVIFKKLQIVDARKRKLRLISLNPIYVPIERNEDDFQWIYPVKQTIHLHH